MRPNKWPIADRYESPNTLAESIYSSRIKVSKDNREKLKFTYQLHFQTFDKYLTIHSGITRKLFINDSTYAGVQNVITESPHYVIFKGDVSKQKNIAHVVSKRVGIPKFNADDNKITVESLKITPDENYDGYALVWKDGTIIFSYKNTIPKDIEFTIPEIYFNFSDEKIRGNYS